MIVSQARVAHLAFGVRPLAFRSRMERHTGCWASGDRLFLVRLGECISWVSNQSCRTLRDGFPLPTIPGTSCQATIVQSLRDKESRRVANFDGHARPAGSPGEEPRPITIRFSHACPYR